jgi:hypothetical protein
MVALESKKLDDMRVKVLGRRKELTLTSIGLADSVSRFVPASEMKPGPNFPFLSETGGSLLRMFCDCNDGDLPILGPIGPEHPPSGGSMGFCVG